MAALDVLQDVLDLSAESALSAAIGAAIAAFAAATRWLVVKMLPARRLWRFSDARDLIMIVASSALVHTGKYERPTTGIGQVRAMSILVPMLTRAYRNIDLQQVRLFSRVPGSDLAKSVLVFGGPKTNEVGKLFMRLLGEALPAHCPGGRLPHARCGGRGTLAGGGRREASYLEEHLCSGGVGCASGRARHRSAGSQGQVEQDQGS